MLSGKRSTEQTRRDLIYWYMCDLGTLEIPRKKRMTAKTPMPKRAVKALRAWIDAAPDGLIRSQRMVDVYQALNVAP